MKFDPTPPRQMTVAEAAWFAGFFDGEGSLIRYLGGKNGRSVCWMITISNTSMEALEKCLAVTGSGSIGRKRVQGNRKDQWQWRVHARVRVVGVLRQIQPYLTVKAAWVAEFLDSQVAA